MSAIALIGPAFLAGRLLWALYRWLSKRANARRGGQDVLEPSFTPGDDLPPRPPIAPEHLERVHLEGEQAR